MNDQDCNTIVRALGNSIYQLSEDDDGPYGTGFDLTMNVDGSVRLSLMDGPSSCGDIIKTLDSCVPKRSSGPVFISDVVSSLEPQVYALS